MGFYGILWLIITTKMTMSKYTNTISLYELFDRFPTDASVRDYLETLLWEDGKPTCPKCKQNKLSRIWKNEKIKGQYLCKDCMIKFTVLKGTIFEASRIPLRKWICAFYIVLTARKGISSYQLSKEIGVTQKTAWFMEHRIRKACSSGFLSKLSGIVEVDESYVGGSFANMHADKKKQIEKDGKTWHNQKGVVIGMRSRDGEVRMKAIKKARKFDIQLFLDRNIEKGATISTDEAHHYKGITGYDKISVNHSVSQFVNGMASTNGVESMWAVLKRQFHGTHHHFSKKHLQRYIDECSFRLNKGNCKIHTLQRIENLCKSVTGKQLTYKQLTK